MVAISLKNRGDRVRALRLKRLLRTQTKLGVLAGVSKSEISKIEAIPGNPTESTLKKVATALGVRVAYLIGEEDTDCGLDDAVSRQALRRFLQENCKEDPVEKTMKRLLEDIAEEGAGPSTPEGWGRLIKYVHPTRSPSSKGNLSIVPHRKKRRR